MSNIFTTKKLTTKLIFFIWVFTIIVGFHAGDLQQINNIFTTIISKKTNKLFEKKDKSMSKK
jgi:hypothetical protein